MSRNVPKDSMSLAIPDKLSFVLLSWTCAFLMPWQESVGMILLIVLAVGFLSPFRPVSETGRKYVNRFLVYALPFAAVLVIVNGILIRDGTAKLHLAFLDFYEEGLHYGLTVSIRLVLLSIAVLVFFTSTRVRDLVAYLQTLGLPNAFVSIILLTLFFLEQLPHRISGVFTAQEARGAPVRGGFISRIRALFVVLSPLVLSSIVESVERGIALELRGYHLHPQKQRSDVRTSTFPIWRYVFLTLTMFLIIFSLVRWLST